MPHTQVLNKPVTTGGRTRLPLSIIRIDGDTQVRAGSNPEFLALYTRLVAEAKQEAEDKVKDGENVADVFEYPFDKEVDVFYDGKDYWLADGYTRLAAFKAANYPLIDVTLHEGDVRAARLFATGANTKHGQSMSLKDKNRAARMLLADPEWSAWSDRAISQRVGLSRPVIAKLRAEILTHIKEETGEEASTKRKYTRNGKEHEKDTSAVKQSNAKRPNKDLEAIRLEFPELAGAVDRKEMTLASAKIMAAQRKGKPTDTKPGEPEWYEDLDIYRKLLGMNSASRLVRDLKAWKLLEEQGVFNGIAGATASLLGLNDTDLTPMASRFAAVVNMPEPSDWKVCPHCKGEGCDKCGGAGYSLY